jgi:hydroxyethylthiazole kinase-like uncharacterized protein yjeF
MKIVTAAEMREIDRLTTESVGIPSLSLMENAGAQVAEFILESLPLFEHRRIVVLCGKGNNGGDGFVAARHLRDAGRMVEAVLFAAPDALSGDAVAQFGRWRDSGGPLRVVHDAQEWQRARILLEGSCIIVDALLGTGLRGPVESVLAHAIDVVNAARPHAIVVAVDIPSGASADTGAVDGSCIRADYTVTFTAPKQGQLMPPAASRCGRLFVRDIGSPRKKIEEVSHGDLRWLDPSEFITLPLRRSAASNKGDFGHALIVAGSRGKTGAAVMSGWSALRVGAGLVTVATAEPLLDVIAGPVPELMTAPLESTSAGTISPRCLEQAKFEALLKAKNVLAIGPGLSTQPETQQFIRRVIAESPIPLILDADGLNAFAGLPGDLRSRTAQKLAITPHPGEMARLLSTTVEEVQADRIGVARRAAHETNALVILKGYLTVIATPEGRVWINSTGNPGMATGGTGDVLTGTLAGLAAQFGESHWDLALAFGVFLHGLAGDIAAHSISEASLMATDLIHCLPDAFFTALSEIERVQL